MYLENVAYLANPKSFVIPIYHNISFIWLLKTQYVGIYLLKKPKKNGLMYGTVPVIMSGANLSNPALIPPNSLINARKFKTAKVLADFLKNVGSRPSLYNEFFKWKDNWFIHPIGKDPKEFPCRICNKLYDDDLYHQINIYVMILQVGTVLNKTVNHILLGNRFNFLLTDDDIFIYIT